MLFRHGFLILSLAASSLLCAACRSSRAPDDPSVLRLGGASEPGAQALPIIRLPNSRSDLHRIEAHAQYAQAVVDDLNGDPEAAVAGYVAAALNDPENETLVMDVSRRCIQSKQLDKALEVLTRATALRNASGALYARLGFVHAQMGNIEPAIAANRTAVKREPGSLIGYQNLYLIFQQNQRSREAYSVLGEAAKVSGVTTEFLLGLAELYGSYALQNPSEASTARAEGIAILERVRQTAPTDPQMRLRLADGFNLMGREEVAAAIYQELMSELPDVPAARDNLRARLAEIYLRNPDDHQRASEHLEGILRSNPTDPQIYLMLGAIAMETTNYAQASDHFSKALLLNPNLENAYQQLARAQLADQKVQEALGTLERGRQRFPASFMIEYLSALAFSHLRDHTNAVKHFTSAEVIGRATDARRLDQLPFFFFEFGAALERMGNYAEAEKQFEKCLELSPNDAAAQNYLGYMLAEQGIKLERARDLIQRALTAEPENAAYLDSMAWVLFKLREPERALEYMLKAIEHSEEEDAILWDHLGDIYAALNEPEKAMEAWRKSLALEPNEVVKKKVEPVSVR